MQRRSSEQRRISPPAQALLSRFRPRGHSALIWHWEVKRNKAPGVSVYVSPSRARIASLRRSLTASRVLGCVKKPWHYSAHATRQNRRNECVTTASNSISFRRLCQSAIDYRQSTNTGQCAIGWSVWSRREHPLHSVIQLLHLLVSQLRPI